MVSHSSEAQVRTLLSLDLLHSVLITVSVQTLLGLLTPTADEPRFPLKAALGVNSEQQTMCKQCAHAELLAMYRYTSPLTVHLSLCTFRGIIGPSDDRS